MADISMAKRFAGINADDQVLTGCLAAAKRWFENAGVHERVNDDLYDFWVCDLAAWMYDHRGDDGATIPEAIISSVHQLRETEG